MANAVGVRKLRRDLSRYLRRVACGERFEVTLRGQTVAVLAPPPGRQDAVGRLVHERSAIPARLDLLDVEPLELPGGPALTELLEQDRADRL